jgi:hypothetical protein
MLALSATAAGWSLQLEIGRSLEDQTLAIGLHPDFP